ncbi:MAG TPA: hypothetical protein VFE36_15685 [Candidatus Baltobacteraceae bacterium]|jgi:hypothetical protein|nr:hypothetical protein [Candidatus Baltobacteraceae bacterium]
MRAPVGGILLALALAACSGGNAAIPHAPPGGTPSHAKVTVTFNVSVPGVRRAHHQRHQRQLSPRLKRVWSIAANTAGIQVVAYASGDRSKALGTTVANISAGSAKCTASDPYGGRTCSLDLQAPPGNDDFVATTYDRVPSGGSIPSNAKQLAYGVATKTITAGSAANVALSLSGVLAKIQLDVTPNSLHTIIPSTATLNVYGLDADNDVIVTDAFIDASGNPISVNLSVDNTLPLATSAASSSSTPPSLTLNPATITAPQPAGVALTYAPQANGIVNASNQTVTVSASPSASSVTTTPAKITAIAPSYATIVVTNLDVSNPYHGGIAFGPTSSYSDDAFFTSAGGNGAMNECAGCSNSSSPTAVTGTVTAPIYGDFVGTGTAFSGSNTIYLIAGNSCETVSSGPSLNPCANSSPAPIPNGSGMAYDATNAGVWYASGTNVAFYAPNGGAPISNIITDRTIGGFTLDSTAKAWFIDTARSTLRSCTVNVGLGSMSCSTGTSLGATPFDILDVTNASGTERLLITDTGSHAIHVRDITGAFVANVSLPSGTTPWYLMPDNVQAGIAWFDYMDSGGAIGIGRIDTNANPPTILMATGPVGPIYSSSASPTAGAMGTSPAGYVYTVFDDAQQLVRWNR